MPVVKVQTPTIWKFPIEVTDSQEILMPGGTQILHVGVQRGIPCLWALVRLPEDANKVVREIVTIGTGHPIDDASRLKYIGTYQLMEGGLVFHIFERD